MSIHAHLPTQNVLQRTRIVRFNAAPLVGDRDRYRTGILIDWDEQQFLITSKILFQSFGAPHRFCEPPLQLDMHVNGLWQTYAVEGYGWTATDLAVLRLRTRVPCLPISLGFREVELGQEVFFLGFANGHPNIGPPPKSDTVPLVGRGTLSSLGEGTSFFLIQCNGSHSFYGGPVVSMSNPDLPHVIGVVSEYGRWTNKSEDDIGFEVPTGFVMCSKVNTALTASITRSHWVTQVDE